MPCIATCKGAILQGVSLIAKIDFKLWEKMTDIILVYITTPNAEEAKKIASSLVQEKLAACANILPQISSVFYWDGALEQSNEALLLLKTSQEKFAALQQRVKELHSYELPCIVALPLSAGLPEYLNWIKQEIDR